MQLQPRAKATTELTCTPPKNFHERFVFLSDLFTPRTNTPSPAGLNGAVYMSMFSIDCSGVLDKQFKAITNSFIA